jgi:TP901 family phage tail tape measure protein
VAEPIFFDVLPKFGFAAMEAGLAKFKASSADAGKVAGESLTGGSDAALKKLQENYMAAANSATKMASSAAKATDEIDVSHRKMVSSSGQVEVAIKRLSETYEAYGAGTSQVIAAENRVVDAWARSDAAAKVHADTVAASNAAIAKSSDAATAQAAAHTKMTAAQDGATASTMAFGRAANTVGAVSAVAFTAAVIESAKAAGNFEQSQMRLVSSAGETQQGMKIVSDGLLKMTGDTGTGLQALSKGMYTVESAGYRGADGLKVMQAAAEGAKSENADLGKVTDGLTTSMTDFGYTPDQARTVMSKLVTAVGESKATFEEFTGSLHSVEPAAAAAGISLDDVYGSLARITQSGTSADQASQNLASAIRSLQAPNQQQAAAMAQIGLSADDVSQKLSSRGLAGTMQYLSETVRNQLDPSGKLSVGVLNENAQAAENAAGMIQQMSPAAAATAQAFANGTMSRKDFTGAIKASNSTDAAQLTQFGQLELKLDGFSKQYKNGRDVLQTYGQVMKAVTGTVEGYNTALQLTGDHTDETNKAIKAVADTFTASGERVKGFDEATNTLNGNLDKARGAFNAAGVELGNVFLPRLTEAVQGLATTGKYLAEHKAVLDTVVISVGALGGAWVITKTAMALGSLAGSIGTGLKSIGGFVMGLAGEYDALAVSARAAATAEAAAAAGGGAGAFGKGAAAGAGARAAVAKGGLAAVPVIGSLWAAYEDDPFAEGGSQYQSPDSMNDYLQKTTGTGAYRPGVGVLPTAGADQYGAAGAQAARRGNRGHDYLPGATVPPTPDVDPNARPDVTAPGGAVDPEAEAAKKKALKAPAGDKNDPIWIAPGSLDGAKGGAGSADVYNPFQQFATGGFTPASLVGFATTFALNQALGNPFGKQLAASKRGETPASPLYVSNVDVDNAQKSAYAQGGSGVRARFDAGADRGGEAPSDAGRGGHRRAATTTH